MRRAFIEKGRLRGLFHLGAAALLAMAGLDASAQEPGRRLAATCAACHGTDGHAVTQAPGPLAGMQKEALLARLRAFREGKAPSTVMGQLLRGYAEDQIEAIAAYLASEKK